VILYLMRRNLPSFPAALFSTFAAFILVVAPHLAAAQALIFFIVIYLAMPRRGSTFEASLPIRGREIVAARVLWILALVWLPIATWLIATAGSGLRVLPVGMVLDSGAVLTLAVLLPCAIQPDQVDEPPVWLTALLWIALAAPSAAITWFLPPAVSMAMFAIAIVVTALWIWSKTPESLEVAPRKAAVTKQRNPVMHRSPTRPEASGSAWKPLMLSLFQGGETRSGNQSYFIFVFYVVMFALGTANSDFLQPLALFYLILPLATARRGTRWLAAFPLSNRARLWCVLLPGVMLPLGCLGLGHVTSPMFFRNRASMSTNAPSGSHERDDMTRVPLEFWRRATGDPVITAPWGETAIADTLSVLRVELQNPYTTNVGSSALFVEWQFQRATTAVYGHPMTTAIYRSRKAEGTLPPNVFSSRQMQTLNVATVIAIALLLAVGSELALSHRFGGSRAGSYLVTVVFMVVALAPVAIDWMYAKYPMSGVTTSIAESALIRLSAFLPTNLAVLTIISALPVIAIYAMLEWQFDRSELVEARRSGSTVGRFLARPVPNFRTS